MAIELKLTRGAASFGLSTTPYAVGRDFAPPAMNMAYNVGSGSSANQYSGGQLIGSRAYNRTWEFEVRILASSLLEADAYARSLTGFVKMDCGDGLFVEYRENTDLPVPLWGQLGAPLRYEVVRGDVSRISEIYLDGKGKGYFVTVALEIRPFAVGLKQRLLNASGGLLEDAIGTADGLPAGLFVTEATTNKMTNPVFGNATWSTNWTAGANVSASKNTDQRFCLPGLIASARLVCNGATNTYTQSINVGNTNSHSLSAYVKRADGGAVTSADVALYYGSSQTTTYVSLGNGWYKLYAHGLTGVNAATATGVAVASGREIYLAGVQMEEKAYHTMICQGDQLGCSWSGTAHASTSARVVAKISETRLDSLLPLAQGAVTVVWRPHYSSAFGATQVFFGTFKADNSANGLFAYSLNTDNKIYFTNGTETQTSTVQSWSLREVVYLTFSWGPANGLVIYRNGVDIGVVASGGVTPPSTTNSAVYSIGHRNGSQLAHGDLLGYDVYETELTAAQALAIYQAQAALVAGGQRVSRIPVWWVKDGDGVVDNCTDATRNNYGVALGVPGSMESDTEYRVTPSSVLRLGYWLMRSNYAASYRPDEMSLDMSGTADANAVGGSYYAFATSGTSSNPLAIEGTALIRPDYVGGEVKVFARLGHTTGVGSYSFYPWARTTLALKYSATPRVTTLAGTAYYFYYCGAYDPALPVMPAANQKIGYGLRLDYSAATGTAKMDWGFVVNGPAALINTSGDYTDWTYLNVKGGQAYCADASEQYYYDASVRGDIVNVLPNSYNVVWYTAANDRGSHAIGDTATIRVDVTPRYALV